jgi:hypothetical protein
MPIYYNGKIVAGSGGGSISGGVDIPASDTPPADGNYWLDTSEEGETSAPEGFVMFKEGEEPEKRKKGTLYGLILADYREVGLNG